MLHLKFFILFFITIPVLFSTAQSQTSHIFWKDDTLLRKKYFDQSLQKKQALITSVPKQYARDYKEIYDHQFGEIGNLWNSTRPVTSPEVNNYLQSIVKEIKDGNPEIEKIDARIVFTRDGWPNAVSMGDGTIAINGGLFVFLNNEAELAFVICHELSHYYLDHTNKSIKKIVELYNSETFKKEVKRLSRQQYGAGREIEELMKKMAFGSRRHSRENETEADRQAFRFFKNTGYDCNAIITCLQLLNEVDDSTIYKPFVAEVMFNFDEYPFKKKWTQKESVLFSAMNSDDGSPFTKQEKDSMKTHPDCVTRISFLRDSISEFPPGKQFLINENSFYNIKKEFFPEISEQEYRNNNLTRNLYTSLLMLQNGHYTSLAVFSIVRDLNILFNRQKDHKLGDIEKETRSYPSDYNLLLRMIDRLRLDEMAAISYYFCKKHEQQMAGCDGFAEQKRIAQKNFSQINR
jgi:Zn-dependent protease with chaperone function